MFRLFFSVLVLSLLLVTEPILADDLEIHSLPLQHLGASFVYRTAATNQKYFLSRTVSPDIPAKFYISTPSELDSATAYAYIKELFSLRDPVNELNIPRAPTDDLIKIGVNEQVFEGVLERLSKIVKTELDGKVLYEVTALFPKSIVMTLGRYGIPVSPTVPQGENCFGAVMAAHSVGQRGAYRETEEFLQFVSKGFVELPSRAEPQFNDLLYFPREQHASVYLFEGYVFQKPSMGIYQKYEIVPYEKVFETFNTLLPLARAYLVGPASSFSWDLFVHSIADRSPLKPPVALAKASAQELKRFRYSCNETLIAK